MMDFEKNVEDMAGMTREAAAVPTVRLGRDGDKTEDETGDETGSPGDKTGDETVATAGDEMAATGGVMYTDEAELEFDEDEMAALQGQRLVAEFRCGI